MSAHPLTLWRWNIAQEQGACAEATRRNEYVLAIYTNGQLVTLAQCRFDQPQRTIERVIQARKRHSR